MSATTTHPAHVTLAGTVTDLLDINVTVPDAADGDISDFTQLAGFAVRDNPRRAHLIVSKILGKHIPVDPETILSEGYTLAEAVRGALTENGYTPDRSSGLSDYLAVGYCETATGLGHAVAEGLGVTYLHTTRKQHPDLPVEARFDEEHSHAVGHLIQPREGISLHGDGPLILVDDELSTGKTALNTIEALHAEFPRPFYVIATLLDARTPTGREAFEARVADMGVNVAVASVLSAYLTLPEDVLERATGARAALPAPAPAPVLANDEALSDVIVHNGLWPADVAVTARHGMTSQDTDAMVAAAHAVSQTIAPSLTGTGSVLVLGTEELLHMPTHVAAHLGWLMPQRTVVNQSTTRSPVHAADDVDYAIRRTETFTAPDEPGRVSRVHNLYDPAAVPAPGESWSDLRHDHIVVIVDAVVADCEDMVQVLRPYARGAVHLVPVTPAPTV
jgi:hypothetical protein